LAFIGSYLALFWLVELFLVTNSGKSRFRYAVKIPCTRLRSPYFKSNWLNFLSYRAYLFFIFAASTAHFCWFGRRRADRTHVYNIFSAVWIFLPFVYTGSSIFMRKHFNFISWFLWRHVTGSHRTGSDDSRKYDLRMPGYSPRFFWLPE
jgi:amino acid permease